MLGGMFGGILLGKGECIINTRAKEQDANGMAFYEDNLEENHAFCKIEIGEKILARKLLEGSDVIRW
jgi:hypothetical protein